MKRTWVAVSTLLVMFQLVLIASAETVCQLPISGQILCDDFEDGSVTDSDPTRWQSLFGGSVRVEDGDLVVRESGTSFPTASPTPAYSHDDISVQTQARLVEGDWIGIALRRSVSEDLVYGGFLDRENAIVGIGGGIGELTTTPIDFDVSEEDVVIQFDAIGSQLDFWAWPADEARPANPIISLVDETIQRGTFYLWSSEEAPVTSQQREAIFRYVQVADQPIQAPLFGDFNGDRQVTGADIDLLTQAVIDGTGGDAFDLNGDGSVDYGDHTTWVKEAATTFFGDANLDGEFNSIDFVEVFVPGEYEDNLPQNSHWSTGDWNGDLEFGTEDLVVAFQDGGYDQGPMSAVHEVPEPTSAVTWIMTLGLLGTQARKRGKG